jgi:hypothetical protein
METPIEKVQPAFFFVDADGQDMAVLNCARPPFKTVGEGN